MAKITKKLKSDLEPGNGLTATATAPAPVGFAKPEPAKPAPAPVKAQPMAAPVPAKPQAIAGQAPIKPATAPVAPPTLQAKPITPAPQPKPATPQPQAKPGAPSSGRVSLELVKPDAKQVCVAGSFNGWKPEATPLTQISKGRWVGDLSVKPGRHEYLFVVDGQWVPDPNAQETVQNPFGGKNSVLIVSE